jgi:Subtilase family/RTX calcium-binding nonapeptide repeat (4 copies)
MATFRDPLFASQWHFRLLGDIAKIWDEYSGAGVNVGVYDDGLQYSHPDLNDNYDGMLHFSDGSGEYDPYPIRFFPGFDADGHGTSVAGIIAAEADNGIGGVGVAWGASLTGVNLLEDPVIGSNTSVELAAYRHAQNFDIMSNSWGYDPFFDSFLNRDDPFSVASVTLTALGDAVAAGRGGLGTVIVKSAGNEATNANGEGINGSRYIVSVAALTQTGAVTSYSNYGTNILVSAGAAAVTTDLTGPNGYNSGNSPPGDYASDFGGTSASAPVVSGVIALMMDANENLGWRDVREILATSAALTGSGLGAAAGFEVEGFASQGSGNWNGGGHAISRDYGYGRVDAFAAVRMAEVWGLWGGAPNTSGNESPALQYTTPDSFDVWAVGGASLPRLSVVENLRVEHIDVTVTFNFDPFIPSNDVDFNLTLVAPDGSQFLFFRAYDAVPTVDTVFDSQNGFTWTFGVALGLGLETQGDWTLETEGFNLGSNHGNITDFTLDFYGTSVDVDDVHHITKDFLTITGAGAANWNGGRDRVLSDTNGGEDWLNLSSIAGSVDLGLQQTGTIRVGGVQWATLQDAYNFENVVTGDGADNVIGNDSANQLLGMRGNDVLIGRHGADTLDGGAGNDRLVGGLASDVLTGGAGHNDLFGGMGDDNLNVTGGSGTLRGEAGNDTLIGGTGADRLDGGTDNDRLTGGGGNDVLTGGGGADAFIFAAGFGHDRITDFVYNVDTLFFATVLAEGMGTYAFVDTFARMTRGEVLFALADGSTLRISGLSNLAQLYDDVVFV